MTYHLIIALSLSAADKIHVDTTGWETVSTVPVYTDGTSINPDGTLDIADPVERAAYEKIPMLKQSCLKGSGDSCYELGKILQNPSFTWIKDLPISIPYLKIGCNKKHQNSCLLLSAAYYNGTGMDKNYYEALRISRGLCSRKVAEGCFNAALNYENGYGVRQDISEAWELYGKSCDYGLQEGCDKYARINQSYQK